MTWGMIGGAAVSVVGGALLSGGGSSAPAPAPAPATNAGTLSGMVAGGLTSAAIANGNTGAQNAANAADPFMAQRAQYQTQLQQLMTNPNSFQQTAGQQAITQQGMDTATAKMSSMGLQGSGAQEAALTNIATTNAGQNYQQQLSNLMMMSGASSGSPGTAGSILQQQNQTNTLGAGAVGAQVGSMVSGGVNSAIGAMGKLAGQGGNINPATGLSTDITPVSTVTGSNASNEELANQYGFATEQTMAPPTQAIGIGGSDFGSFNW